MLCYKLTTQDGKTRAGKHNETQWGEGVTHTADGSSDLCGPGWLHFYTHPLLAVLFNPIHANLENPVLWEANADGAIKHDKGLKAGCTKLTTLRTIPLPAVTTEQRVRFAILCAKAVHEEKRWRQWADDWLNNINRSAAAAYAAEHAAYAAAHAARAAHAAAHAAHAARAAHAAARAAHAAYAATRAAYAAAIVAANAAAYAAEHADSAAVYAAYAADLDLITLAEEACR